MSRKKTKWIGNIILMGCSMVFAFVVAEVGLRIIGIKPVEKRFSFYQFDETLGWVTKPNSKFYRSSVFYAHFNYYNQEGFPTDANTWQKQLNQEKSSIALVGDSFVEGYYIPYEETFAHRIADRFKDYQALNLGVSGYAPDQYLLNARKYLQRFPVKAIAVFFFAYNDVDDVHRDRYQTYAKPLFRETFDRPVNLPLKKHDTEVKKGLLASIAGSSAVYVMLRPFIKSLTGLENMRPPALQKYEPQRMEKAVRLMAQIKIENSDVPFFIYYIPAYEEWDAPDTLQYNLALFAKTCLKFSLICHSMPKPQTGLPRDLYIVGEGHFNREGSQFVADHVIQLLVSSLEN